MFAQLGSIIFDGVKGFESLEKRRATNFAEHSRIEGKPRLQRIGSDLQSINITIHLHAQFTNPQKSIDELDNARETAEVLPFVMGNGKVIGDFVIEIISETIMLSGPLGELVEASVELTLLEYYDPNKPLQEQTDAVSSGFAMDANDPLPVEEIQLAQTPAAIISGQVTEATVKASSVDSDILAAQDNPSDAPRLMEQVTDNLNDLGELITDMQQNIDNASTLEAVLSGLDGTLPGVLTGIGTLLNYAAVGDVPGAAAANLPFQIAVADMFAASNLLNTAVILRRA